MHRYSFQTDPSAGNHLIFNLDCDRCFYLLQVKFLMGFMLGVMAMMVKSLCTLWLSAAPVSRITVVKRRGEVLLWMFFHQSRVPGL